MRKFIYTGKQIIAQEDGRADVVRNLEDKQWTVCRFEIKAFDEKTRRFKGVATTGTPDEMDDIVDPSGALFSLPIPFLYQHDSHKPVGFIDVAKLAKGEWQVEGFVHAPEADAPQSIRERLDVAWYELKKRIVRGLSIGFNPKEWSFIKETGGVHWLKWKWLELSMVTIPANSEATLRTIKSIDEGLRRAAPGRNTKSTSSPARAGAPNLKGSSMKTYTQEALAGLSETRKTKAARMEELRELKSGEGRKFTDEERAEFDGLDTEIEDLDDEIRVTQRHVSNISRAKPVDQSRGAPYGFVKKLNDVAETFKGETGLKRAVASIYAQAEVKQGRLITPLDVVQERWGKTNPTLVAVMKAAVAGGGTESGEWGAELAQADTRYTGDFVEYLYAKTVFDQLPLVRVPHNVVIKGQDGAFTGYFVGQSKAIKVSKGDFSSTTTVPYKAAGLCVVSNELLRDSSPEALGLCGTGLRNAVAQAIDSLFFSATAVSAGVSPAGILNGVSAGTTNGGDAQSVATDIKALWAPFITANNTEGNFVWIMTPTLAVSLSLMRNALGQLEFPSMNASGGTFMGYPVFVGGNIGAGDVILMNASEVWKIGDLGVSLSTSDSAMIEQDNAPSGATDTPVAATANMTSMYQEDSTAIRVIRPISWGKRRAGAVAYIGNAAWGSESS